MYLTSLFLGGGNVKIIDKLYIYIKIVKYMMRYSPSPDFKDGRLSRVLEGLRPPPFFPLIFKNGATCLCEKTVVVKK